ncbi:MAG TPA: class I SAM-dependent methyltransferase [Candidatus Binatia bacterium]|nr:class I SAM-dependent methyltransferase [Candidatus Binatia bacterium]
MPRSLVAMSSLVQMAIKPVLARPASTALQESLAFIEKRLRPVAENLAVAGDTVLGGFPNAEFAHQAAMRLLSAGGQNARQWQIGIATGTGDAALQALQLASAASSGEAIVASEVHGLLAATSRARYLPTETVAGRHACRTLPRGVRRAFMITPMGQPGSPERARSRFVYEQLVAPACARLVPRCIVVHPDDQAGSDVWADISNTLFSADHVLAYLGLAPWNPNVMVEVGYRLATGKPLVILAPRGLPFDLANRRTVMLPEDPAAMSGADIDAAIDKIVQLMAERETQDLGWADLRPTATIELDLRDVPVKEHRVGDASQQTADLFDLPRTHLIGMGPEDLMEHLGSLMDREQHEAFLQEQALLYGQADMLSVARRPVYAEVPIFMTKHSNPAYFHRAFLPAILTHERVEDRLLTRVVYLDVSRHLTCDSRGVCRVPKPGPNLDILFSRYADAYDAVLPNLPNYTEALDEHCTRLAPRPGRAILDLGAGTGNLTLRLLEAGATVTAVDRNRAMLDRLHDKCTAHEDRLTVVERDAADLSCFDAGSFDAVNVLLMLFAVEQPASVIREAWRVLRPGGSLVLTEPAHSFDLDRILEETEEHLKQAGTLEALATGWETVKRVNVAFRSALEDGGKAEDFRELLQELAGHGSRVRSKKAYRGHCLTLWVSKPS